MKKLVAALILATSMAAFSQAQETTAASTGDIGLGYQGIFLGNFFNGISVRYAPADVPMVAQAIYARYAGDVDGRGDGSINMLQGRLAYVLAEREQSKFYVGGKFGYMNVSADSSTMIDGFNFGPMFGTEFRFTELPEIGFNFDVGYDFNTMDAQGTDLDVDGINVTFGCHYYF